MQISVGLKYNLARKKIMIKPALRYFKRIKVRFKHTGHFTGICIWANGVKSGRKKINTAITFRARVILKIIRALVEKAIERGVKPKTLALQSSKIPVSKIRGNNKKEGQVILAGRV